AGAEVPAARAGAAEVQAITAARASAAIRFLSIVCLLTKADAVWGRTPPLLFYRNRLSGSTTGLQRQKFPPAAHSRLSWGPWAVSLTAQPLAAISARRASAAAQSLA